MPLSIFFLLLPPLISCQNLAPCALPNRLNQPQACYDFMRQAAADPSLFWYGNQLDAKCAGNPEPRNITCLNALPLGGGDAAQYQTLGSRAFNIPDFSSADFLKDLKCPMTVTYNSPQEFAYGCNTTQGGGQFVFDAHPNLAPIASFYYRYAPAINVPTCTLSSLCTLIFVDANYAVVHNIFPNWPRDNPLLDGYVTPGAQRIEPDPYVWTAYQQSGPIDFSPPEEPSDSFQFDINDFKSSFNLTGPIAMSWILASRDAYTDRYLLQFGTSEEDQLANCPVLLEQVLSTAPAATELQSDLCLSIQPESLKYWLAVRFDPPLFATRAFPGGGGPVWADPITNKFIPSEFANNKPKIFPTARLSDPTPADLMNKMFTLLVVRRDNAVTPAGDALVLIHYMEINIALTDTASLNPGDLGNEGTVVLPYAGCDKVPLEATPRGTFYMLLYEQKDGEVSSPDNLVVPECPVAGTQLRCRFPLKMFAEERNLELVGLSRWRVETPPRTNVPKVPVFVKPRLSARTAQRSRGAATMATSRYLKRTAFMRSLPAIRW